MKDRELKDKEKQFIYAYMSNGYNAVKAYMFAFDAPQQTADKNSYKVYNRPIVKQEIQRLIEEKCASLNITAERIIEELATMAFAQKGDEDYNATIKARALDLLQKQLGLQNQKVNAQIDNKTTITVTIDEE